MMRSIYRFALCAGLVMLMGDARAQSLLSARALGTAGVLTGTGDTRTVDVNPAALAGIRDWDVTVACYGEPGGRTEGVVFQTIAAGRRFLDRHALAFQYSPGTRLEFTVPTSVTLGGSASIASNERVEYSERFSAAYAYSFTPGLSAGVVTRWRTTEATDTRFELQEIDTTALIVPDQRTYASSSWFADAGILWHPVDPLTIAVVGRNLVTAHGTELPAGLDVYALPEDIRGEIGLGWKAMRRLNLTAGATSSGDGSAGAELELLEGLTVRTGVRFATDRPPLVTAMGAGLGFSSDFFSIDAGYFRFLDRNGHTGQITEAQFDPSRIIALDLNPYAADRLAVSIRAMFGNVRTPLARIEGVTLSGGIYPSALAALAESPIGTASIRNISSRPIVARVSFFVDRLMDAPTESGPVTLAPGEQRDVPVTAVFNEHLREVTGLSMREGTVAVSAAPAGDEDDRRQARVMVYGRNDWNGDVMTLRWFVTPDDPMVMRTAREILHDHEDSLAAMPGELRPFRSTALLLDAFAGRLMYVADPRQSADRVQYPAETIDLRGGDCDDMTVCFSSLLNSIGIPTAFVDVVPPGRPAEGHIYLLVDTRLDPRFGGMVSSNPKRFVVRKGKDGRETVWIPVETTVIRDGFAEAWTAGAQRYFDDVEIGLGLARGWVRIVDVQ